MDIFKKLFNQEKRDDQKNVFIKGLAYGLGGALVILVIILLIIFGGSIKDRVASFTDGEGSDQVGLSKLRYTVVTSKNCQDDCFNITNLITAINQEQNNVKETGRDVVYIEDGEGKALVEKYNITRVPTLLVAGDLNKNASLANAWQVLGEIINGVFVYREIIPPYIEVASGELKGKISAIFLTDESCEQCYDVNLHNFALNNLGVVPAEVSFVDVSSDQGQNLVSQYNITKAPTILLQGEANEYQGLVQVWELVGEVASDGTYVFTQMDEMGTYRDLATGQIVEVEIPDMAPVQ